MTAIQIKAILDASDLYIFGIRSLHSDEVAEVGQEMPDSYVWDDDDRTEQCIGGTCCFIIPEYAAGYGLDDIDAALQRAYKYILSGRYALLGGKYTGNNDLIEEPHTVAIRNAVVLATWQIAE